MSKYCYKCGQKLVDFALYCSSCGAKQEYGKVEKDTNNLSKKIIDPIENDKLTDEKKTIYPINNNKKKNNNWVSFVIFLIIAAFFAFGGMFNNDDTSDNSFSEPIVSKPSSGIYQEYSNLENVAPFKIITRQGSGNYFIKIKDNIGMSVMTIFINDGETVDLKVPLGNYEIFCASGDDWYGQDYLFGPDTSYSKMGESFNFTLIGNQYNGHSLTLYQQVNGNLDEVPISESEWK